MSSKHNIRGNRSEAAAAIRVLRDRTQDEPMITPMVRDRALYLLRRYAGEFPEALARAKNPATWAAGGVHAAFMSLRGPGLTSSELGVRFDVSAASVSMRSAELRRYWRRERRTLETIMAEWEDELRRSAVRRKTSPKNRTRAVAPPPPAGRQPRQPNRIASAGKTRPDPREDPAVSPQLRLL